ncbi:MAG: GNAT family N-acetyltransferase [Bacteroidetes bacterium]|nr:GNAT family N-acetyltransferase [Bacteroidota bacterium]
MPNTKIPNNEIRMEPLQKRNWNMFEDLMGEKGGCGGCWCMLFRLSYKEFQSNKPHGNKLLMQKIVFASKPTGLMAIYNDKAIGWIAFAPREDYIKIEKARTLKRIDDKPVWSITCFFIRKEFRRMGISKIMIKSLLDYAKKKNIKTLEAYPAIPYDDKVPPPFLWVGVLSAFLQNGFKIVQQNGKSKAIVRISEW